MSKKSTKSGFSTIPKISEAESFMHLSSLTSKPTCYKCQILSCIAYAKRCLNRTGNDEDTLKGDLASILMHNIETQPCTSPLISIDMRISQCQCKIVKINICINHSFAILHQLANLFQMSPCYGGRHCIDRNVLITQKPRKT